MLKCLNCLFILFYVPVTSSVKNRLCLNVGVDGSVTVLLTRTVHKKPTILKAYNIVTWHHLLILIRVNTVYSIFSCGQSTV